MNRCLQFARSLALVARAFGWDVFHVVQSDDFTEGASLLVVEGLLYFDIERFMVIGLDLFLANPVGRRECFLGLSEG